jgi:hypothetical protein
MTVDHHMQKIRIVASQTLSHGRFRMFYLLRHRLGEGRDEHHFAPSQESLSPQKDILHMKSERYIEHAESRWPMDVGGHITVSQAVARY